ncbi:hypothetical protein EUX98_g5886 [Antrodiella citrinella]|uniref:Uncharacterized protein n=1 Tax=Antrodiella citrinella TaxID=2447956 RepID=A0A4S4MQI3_9APHY|nr:hypothetical protein EUX98_g5886 [Antrodiella citrinella]
MSLELDSVPSTFSHSTYSQSSFSQSAYSLSSQSHSGHSHSAHSHSSHSDSSHASLASRSSTKKAPLPDPIILLPPPAYSVEPPPTDRPIIVTTESAPEIRHVSSTAVPPRPTSVPTPVAPQPPDPVARPSELRKQRSRRQSIVPPPGGLDKIDELDETDPLGFAWHHDSRYEGVKKVVDGADSKESKDSAKALLEKAERKKAKKAAGADPNAPSFSVKPGQIFPAFNPYHPQPTINPVSQGMAPGAPSQPQLGSATPQDLSYHVQRPALRSHSQSQPADPSQFLAQRLSSGAYLQPQPPQQSHSPAPPSDFAHHTLRQPSSASLHVHVQPQSPARQTSTHSLPELGTPRSQYEQLQPPQRPPSVHSQSSSELPYAQTLPNPHPLNRAQTPPRHRLSRMAQDMVAGSAPPPMGTPGFANDPAYNAFPQTPAPSSQTAQYGVPAGAPPAQPYRSSSGSSSRNRPPAPGLPPRLQQQQQMHAPPRPDIVLPPRHQAAKNRASVQAQGPPQPHYLPKRLVMPTPLQPMQGPQALPQQQSQMQGMLSYGSQSGSGSGPAGDMMPVGLGADYLGAPTSGQVQQQQQQQQQKKAKEIPVSHGRNLLRKRATVNGASPTNAAAAAPDSSHQYHPHHHSLVGGGSSSRDAAVGMVNGVHVVGNGSGMGYVPSSNASAAMFAAKADAPLRPAPSSRSQSQGAVDARAEWESKMREKELQKEREREWKREMALESQMQKEREREAQKEKGGRKLSKRR